MSGSESLKSDAQRKGIQKTLIIVGAIILMSLTLFVNKILAPPHLSKEQLREKGVFLFEKPRLVNEFSLLNQKGEAISKVDLEGKWSLVFFGFTHCPDICPTTLALLNKFHEQMKKKASDRVLLDNTRVVLATVDPARDTPEVLAEYLAFFNPNFWGVTGEFIPMYNFATNLNAPFKKIVQGDDYTMDHSAYIFILNARGDYQGFIKPPFTVEDIVFKYTAVRNLYHGQ